MLENKNIFGLDNKYVLITGAGGLLGQKHAEAVASVGGIPILTDISSESLHDVSVKINKQFNCNPICFSMDVTSESSVMNVHKALLAKSIPVDVLINNAARNPAVGSQGLQNPNRLENLDLSSWNLDLTVGLTGAVICSKVFGTDMAKRGKGNIINISSDLGVIAPDQRLYEKENVKAEEQDVKPVSYSVVKHGLIGLTKYLSTYWAHKNVRCNALSPGGVFNGQNEVFLNKIQDRIPMGRMAHHDEYMGAIIFLASEASSYMNGANLIIDGGRSVW